MSWRCQTNFWIAPTYRRFSAVVCLRNDFLTILIYNKLGHQQSSNSLQSSSSIFYCFQWCPFLLFLMGKWEEGCPAKAESGNSIGMMKLNCKSMAKQFCPQFWVNRLTNNHFVLGTSLFGIVQVLGFAPVFKWQSVIFALIFSSFCYEC